MLPIAFAAHGNRRAGLVLLLLAVHRAQSVPKPKT
jgi:hypothetical protein